MLRQVSSRIADSATSVTSGGTLTTGTTTTTGAASWQCLVTFRLGSAVSFAAAQWNVDYTATGGDFTGLADAVQCRAVSGTGLTPAFNDVDASHSLQVGLFTISSFTGPGDMVEAFDRFWRSVEGGSFDPRAFILEDFTLAKRAAAYVEIADRSA